ncbi:MAG TPA: glycoside hydrolase family 16 protein [Ktedonobacteraceae bacterium]|nr:glycoside hydrolase family 16 protein [Ktedonobacteraceae bacterium]
MRTIEFSGNQWVVKDGGEERRGPGPNYFSSSPENVWVDSQGQLHLKITNRNNRWYCAEVSLEKPLGYGTYEFFVNGRFDQLDPHVVDGLFLYEDDAHEIDIEFGRWGKRSGENLQYVLQPGHNPFGVVR